MAVGSTRARIATICQAGRFYDTIEENRAYVLGKLDIALSHHPDLVCLPENFSAVSVPDRLPETIPGPTIDAVCKRARAAGCYVVCPLLARRPEDPDGAKRNAAVVIGRAGDIVGIYEKRRPVTSSHDYTEMERGVLPGAGDGVFDLDFGRIGIRICFDVGFAEDWSSLETAGARVVVWPSAYDGGAPLSAYALLHRYWVVTSVRTARSRIIDPLGELRASTDERIGVAVQDINFDYAVCHYDFNWNVPERILADHAGHVDIRSSWDSVTFLVEPTDPSVTTASLMSKYGFETTAQYHDRHRAAHAALCAGCETTPQAAAHGNRPVYAR